MTLKDRPSACYEKIINVGRFCARAIGVDAIVPNYRMNYRTYIVALCALLYYVFSFNTILIFIKEDKAIILEVMCTTGAGITGVAKFVSGIYHARKYYILHIKLMEIYCKYEKMGMRYEAVLYKSSERSRTILVIGGLLYVLSIAPVIVVPLFMLWYKKQQYMMLHFIIPGVDTDTQYGYWFTFIFHMMIVVIAAFGFYSGDMFILTYLTHSLLFVDILRLKVEDINQLASDEERPNKNLSENLKDILKWHQTTLEFTDLCNDVFHWIVTLQIACSASSIVVTLFVILHRDWPAAFAFLLFSFNSLYEYCILGTRIDICNDNFCAEIYNIHWYNMSISERKIVRLMLMRAQSPTLIDIGGIYPLTVATALAITRSIYGIFTLMLQFR